MSKKSKNKDTEVEETTDVAEETIDVVEETIDVVEETTDVAEETTDVAEEDTEVEDSKKSVSVVWRKGTRTYTKEIHGKDFKKLAESFAKKFNGKLE